LTLAHRRITRASFLMEYRVIYSRELSSPPCLAMAASIYSYPFTFSSLSNFCRSVQSYSNDISCIPIQHPFYILSLPNGLQARCKYPSSSSQSLSCIPGLVSAFPISSLPNLLAYAPPSPPRCSPCFSFRRPSEFGNVRKQATRPSYTPSAAASSHRRSGGGAPWYISYAK
jgi:hypothetical protein